MTSRLRFIIAAAVSQCGSWLTTTAIMVYLQSRFGPSAVIFYFLARSLAPFLVSRMLVSYSGFLGLCRSWVVSQLVLAGLALGLVPAHGLVLILSLSAMMSIVQGAAVAWFMSMVSDIRDDGERSATVRGVSAANSLALVAGSALGGVMQSALGSSSVFIVDAVTFVGEIVLVPWRGIAHTETSRGERLAFGARLASIAENFRTPRGVSLSTALVPIAGWFAFTLFGAVFNAVEMPVLAGLKGFGAERIGLALGAFGAGGFVVFIATLAQRFKPHILIGAVGLALTYTAWLLLEDWLNIVAFFLCGMCYSLYNSAIRDQWSKVMDRDNLETQDVWAWLGQSALLVSVVIYLAAMAYFRLRLSTLWLAALGIALAVAICIPAARPPTTKKPGPLNT